MTDYKMMLKQAGEILDAEPWYVAAMSNLSALTKGVCGAAVRTGETQVVPDVHLFPGHVACDSASESEIVIPIRHDGEIAAVLDIDSVVKDRFSAEDAEGLEAFVRLIEEKISWE